MKTTVGRPEMFALLQRTVQLLALQALVVLLATLATRHPARRALIPHLTHPIAALLEMSAILLAIRQLIASAPRALTLAILATVTLVRSVLISIQM